MKEMVSFLLELACIRHLWLQSCLGKFGGCLKFDQLVMVLEGLSVSGDGCNVIYSASFSGFQGPDGKGRIVMTYIL